ncbi:MAG: DUF1127 domain-containing protein [Hyphomicrobiaceae bacterium]|nr:DUF1127 domain-containing protein [Hyphomicrobiaceae bacterium]
MSPHTLTGGTPASAMLAFFRPSPRLAGVRAAVHRYLALRTAHAELTALDDRTLKDIGLDRSEITSVLCDRSGERTIAPSPGLQTQY